MKTKYRNKIKNPGLKAGGTCYYVRKERWMGRENTSTHLATIVKRGSEMAEIDIGDGDVHRFVHVDQLFKRREDAFSAVKLALDNLEKDARAQLLRVRKLQAGLASEWSKV